jgi:hypothetical protein
MQGRTFEWILSDAVKKLNRKSGESIVNWVKTMLSMMVTTTMVPTVGAV